MLRYARALAKRGLRVVTFDFPGSRKNEPLEAAYARVVAEVHRRFPNEPLAIGGKSMGGRIASQIVAKQSLPVRRLVFFGYPLHPPKKPDVRRDAHLPAVRVPMLFVSGTRDPFGSPAELTELTKKLGGASLLLIEGADHSLEVSSAHAQRETDSRVWDAATDFILVEVEADRRA